ncbi:MAG: sugar phosphate isomerase/epimerase [Planctomycetes bacterium]|nr:sugar phosphate isomerase/epimerase [Planctomycetota bacterium]
MKYGMNLLLWTDDATKEDFFPVLERLKKMGFDGVEIPVFDLDPAKYAKLGKRLDAIGLQRTAVTVRTVDDNPISPDRAVREKGVAMNKAVLDCCQAGGMKLLVGPYYAALGHFTGRGPTAQEWSHGVESMRQVAVHAETCGVTLALEPLNRFEIYLLNSAADGARFVREVAHPRCRLMYDTFHANIEEKSISSAIAGCASELAHVHISENDRSTPGRGQVNWAESFDALQRIGYDGWLTIEAFGQALPALAAATKIWRPMFENEEKLAADGLAFMQREWTRRSSSPLAARKAG